MLPTHASYSSINLFLKNPRAWHNKYVLGIRDRLTSPAALVGTGFHKYMEMRLLGTNPLVASEIAAVAITSCTEVDWGKTGSVEKALNELESLIGHAEDGVVGLFKDSRFLEAEYQIRAKIPGLKFPILSYLDALHEDMEGGLYITDWKTKKSFNETIPPVYKLQAVVYFFQVKAQFKREAKMMQFVEIKASKNKDGSPQVNVLKYDFTNPEVRAEIAGMKILISKVMKKMASKKQDFLPNISDEYEGETSLNSFIKATNEYACTQRNTCP